MLRGSISASNIRRQTRFGGCAAAVAAEACCDVGGSRKLSMSAATVSGRDSLAGFEAPVGAAGELEVAAGSSTARPQRMHSARRPAEAAGAFIRNPQYAHRTTIIDISKSPALSWTVVGIS